MACQATVEPFRRLTPTCDLTRCTLPPRVMNRIEMPDGWFSICRPDIHPPEKT